MESHALKERWSRLLSFLPFLPGLLHEIVLLSERIVSFACRNPSADILEAFDIFNIRTIMKTITGVVLLGLYKNVPLPSTSFIFWFECLLQPFTNKWVYSFERALSPVGSLLCNPLCPYSTGLVITIATTACGACALSQKQSLC